jgi:hypothetical protein
MVTNMGMARYNKLWVGLIPGILVPVIILGILYVVRYSGISVIEVIRTFKSTGVLSKIISLAVVPDLLVFFLFIRIGMLRAARGVILATFLFVFLILCIRWF